MAAVTPSPATNDTKSTNPPASPVESSGAKRKRTAEPKFYAVKFGFQPGVYHTWNDCLTQVTGFKGAVFQSFPTLEEANAFLTGTQATATPGSTSTSTKFYGVQRGRKPGVYTDWAVTQDQVREFRGPKYRKFATWAEADAYVRQGQQSPAELQAAPDPEHKRNSAGKMVLPGAPGLTPERPTDADGNEFPPGLGPLPPGAVDGFDPNIVLDPTTGKLKYRSPYENVPTKQQPGRPGPLKIYTDGSSLRNGTTGAKAGVGVYFGPGDESRNVSEPLKGSRQTNQRAELTAIIRALDIAPRHRDVTIFTDSKYAINCVTVWFVNWQRNKWMTAQDKPVENKDLIQSILLKIEERTLLNVKTLFEWVRGHSRDPGNEAADRLAVNGAQNASLGSNDLSTPEAADDAGDISDGGGGDFEDDNGEAGERVGFGNRED
ncbi:hypothetical protein AJ78_00064 [Emergomyces pasteurianus Ep9510]|uniref:ribonuclease H n=1 Tax=Emergomyces pasteurianus Ep9510 TaxID=1447872 RepID=A0A1J9PUH2_9EURO|nr:hypothetical protein AJ78_00064 [Emergomyces pasteurianus Ep9510]